MKLSAKLVFITLSYSLLLACQPNNQESEVILESSPIAPSSDQEPIQGETEEQAAARLLATFPAQQRAPADPEVIAEGKLIFEINCRACHGADLRGGDLGGPNLLRSQLVLQDLEGELITPVILEGRNNPGMTVMPPQTMTEAEAESVATYIHSVVATSRGQGAPPPGEEVELNIVVGDPEAGQQYFQKECAQCHSVSGDLAGIASIIDSPENLQSSWVAGKRRGAPNPNQDPNRTQVMVTVTLSSGEKITGKLGRIDDFIVSLTTDNGQYHSFTLHENTTPNVVSVVKEDPLERHRKLLSEYTDEIMHNVTAYLVTLK